MSADLPPLPSHPEHAWLWTEAEKLMIAAYGKACAEAARAADEALMRQALDALESCDAAHPSDGGQQWYDDKMVEAAIAALRARTEGSEG